MPTIDDTPASEPCHEKQGEGLNQCRGGATVRLQEALGTAGLYVHGGKRTRVESETRATA